MKTLAIPTKEEVVPANQESLNNLTKTSGSAGNSDRKSAIKDKEEPIVIPDECGDTLWDAVLAQETK